MSTNLANAKMPFNYLLKFHFPCHLYSTEFSETGLKPPISSIFIRMRVCIKSSTILYANKFIVKFPNFDSILLFSFVYREIQWKSTTTQPMYLKPMSTAHQMAVGRIQSNSYSLVLAMQLDWAMSGDSRISFIVTAEVSAKVLKSHELFSLPIIVRQETVKTMTIRIQYYFAYKIDVHIKNKLRPQQRQRCIWHGNEAHVKCITSIILNYSQNVKFGKCIRNTQQQQIRVESQSESKRNNLNIYCDCSVEQFYLLSSCFFVCVLAIAAIVNMTEH